MPINTTQLTLLTSKKTFNEFKEKLNDVINIVNGLPSTVVGALTRLGGVVDGQSTGAILDFPVGYLFVIGAGGVGVGDFLNTNQPGVASGKLHLHSATTDSLMYISQNTDTKISGITFQTGNSATSAVKNAAFIGAVSNNITQASFVTFLSSNLNHSMVPADVFDNASVWGGTTDISGISRLTLISGDKHNISPHAGPSSHLNVPLRIQRAITYDVASSNSSPLLSIIGYTGGATNVPVRVVIGDKETTAIQDVRRPFAVVDFLGDGADEASAISIKAQIAAEYDSESGINGSLKFSVRNNTTDIISSFRIVGGSTSADSGKLIVSNTAVVNTFSKENVTGSTDKNAQLIIKQFHHADKGTLNMGLMIEGSDTDADYEQVPVIRLQNILAKTETSAAGWTAATKKWAMRVNGSAVTSGEWQLRNYPDISSGWNSGNTQIRVIPGGQIDQFIFGNRNIVSGGTAAGNGASIIVAGGDLNGTLGGSIVLDSPRFTALAGGEYPTSWKSEVYLNNYMIYPAGMGGGEYTESKITLNKTLTSNIRMGIGNTAPHGILHLHRSSDWANVYVESSQQYNNATMGAKIFIRDASGSNNYVILNSIPDVSYGVGGGFDRGIESPISLLISRVQSPSTTNSIAVNTEMSRFTQKVHSFEVASNGRPDGVSQFISFRNQVTNAIFNNTGDSWDAVKLVARSRAHASYGSGTVRQGGTFEIWTARDKVSHRVLAVSESGFMGLGRSNTISNPLYSLDLIEATSANVMIAFSNENPTHSVGPAATIYRTWVMGSIGSTPGLGSTALNPFIIAASPDRTSNQTGSLSGKNIIRLDREENGSIQRFSFGNPSNEALSPLTMYTSANTSSPNWPSFSPYPRVGVGNSEPSFTFVVDSTFYEYGGMASYGLSPAIRLIQNKPGGYQPTVPGTGPTASGQPSRFLGTADPGMKYQLKQWMIGVKDGQMFIGQGDLGRTDSIGTIDNTPFDESSKTLRIFSNTVVSNTVTQTTNPQVGTLATGVSRIYGGTKGLVYQDYSDSGSLSINGPQYPLAGGLFVSDTNRKSDINNRHHFATFAPSWEINNTDGLAAFFGNHIRPIPGLYPSFVAVTGNPIHSANGAHSVISITGGTTSNGFTTANTMKNIVSLRRYKELPPSDTIISWNTLAWHDGISVDELYTIPMPNTSPTDNVFNLQTEPETGFYKNQSSKVWWERRPHPGGTQGGSVTGEYSESHLFGSSNNHVMTIHANATYQGVHVEKGGIYAENGILAWARILPRGDYSIQLNTTGEDGRDGAGGGTPPGGATSSSISSGAAVTILDSHNIASVQEFSVGSFMVTFGNKKPVGNNYAVVISGTNNLYIAGGNAYRKISMEYATYTDLNSIMVEASQSFHSIRVANNTHIGFQSRAMESDDDGRVDMINIDEDEIYLVVVGRPDPAHWRG